LANSNDIGTAYITVIPSTEGIGKTIEDEVTDSTQKATEKSGGLFSSMFSSVSSWGTAAIAGIGTAVGGLALKGGFDKALAIDDAKNKLEVLGLSTDEVSLAMQNASEAVKGTLYGTTEAAEFASKAVASGIKPGEDLDKTMRAVADAAAFTGQSFDSMGGIFTRVQMNGGLTSRTLTLSQIAEDTLGDWHRYTEIKDLNGLVSDTIYPGQVLKIPIGDKIQTPSSNETHYAVQSGDTLSEIANNLLNNWRRYTEIKSLNGLTSDTIYPGQVLRIPEAWGA
jgi:hypothetical protein